MVESTLLGCPDPAGLDAQVTLASLRAQLFGRADAIEIGRYRLLRLLGRGAHGSVFEAHDRELRRRLAVKVLRADVAGLDRATATRRLLREASTMGQLNHPNVVEVYAAGTEGTQVWIAMELVEGTTLAVWAEQQPDASVARFNRARLILEQAARGLAAAHGQRIIHRDFKPANVLVDRHDHTKVVDFGLARAWHGNDQGSEHPGAPTQGLGSVADPNTMRMAGTVRYMSPEQLRGERVAASSDQFNFGVTAWELVYGVHPFPARDPRRQRGVVQSPALSIPSRSPVPRWYGRVLRRALSRSAADRFDCMDALVAALCPRRRQRRRGAAVGASLLAMTAIAVPQLQQAEQGSRCSRENAKAKFAKVWNDPRKASVLAGLRASEVPQIEATARSLEEGIGGYGEEWVAQHVDICQAHWQAARLPSRELDARMGCLQDSLRTMDALLTRFESAEPQVAVRSVAAVHAVVGPMACNDVDLPQGDPHRPETSGLRRRLSVANADYILGGYADAATLCEAIANEAKRAGLQGLAGEALELGARAWSELNDARRYAALEEAYYIAVGRGESQVITRRATSIAMQHAYASDYERAELWLRHADAALARDGDDRPAIRIAHVRGIVALRRGQLHGAISIFENVLQRLGGAQPSTDELVWLASGELALAHFAARNYDQALALRSALYIETREALGRWHPRVAQAAAGLGKLASVRGDHEQAIEFLREAVDVSERAYGPVNTRTAIAEFILAATQYRFGDLQQAERSYLRALRANGTARDKWRSRILRSLGRIRGEQGRPELAASLLSESLSIGREVWRPAMNELATAGRAMGEAWLELGRLDDARAEFDRALKVQQQGHSHSGIVRTRVGLATVAQRALRWNEAIEHYELAIEACSGQGHGGWCSLAAARLASLYGQAGRLQVARAWLGAASNELQVPPTAQAGGAAMAAIAHAEAQISWAEGRQARARALNLAGLAGLRTGVDYASRVQRRMMESWDARAKIGHRFGGTPDRPPKPRPLK